jgi:hypothetical protein
MDRPDRTSVSSRGLDELTQAVERANFLNTDSSRSYLLDPCCMLEALSDVYDASRRLIVESCTFTDSVASGSAP